MSVTCFSAQRSCVAESRELVPDLSRSGPLKSPIGRRGTAPATYLANHIGARLYSVASADYGHLMLWQSPATLLVKARAIEKGYSLADFADAMSWRHPVENLSNLREGSVFFVA